MVGDLCVVSLLSLGHSIERRWRLKLLLLFWDLLERLLDVLALHVSLKVVLEPLTFRRQDLPASLGLYRRLRRVLSTSAFLVSSHSFLKHEGVHVDVRGQPATISRITLTAVFELFLGLPVLFNLDHNFFVRLDISSFQLVPLFDLADALRVLGLELIQLVVAHLADCTLVVRLVTAN